MAADVISHIFREEWGTTRVIRFGTIVDLLGKLVGIVTLTSLIVSLFSEPLLPFLGNLLTGIVGMYRILSDIVFSGIATAIMTLFQIVPILPALPDFSVPPLVQDLLVIYSIIGGSLASLRLQAHSLFWVETQKQQFAGSKRHPAIRIWITSLLFWPLKIVQYRILDENKIEALEKNIGPYGSMTFHAIREAQIIWKHWLINIAIIVAGTIAFFGLAVAQQQLGL